MRTEARGREADTPGNGREGGAFNRAVPEFAPTEDPVTVVEFDRGWLAAHVELIARWAVAGLTVVLAGGVAGYVVASNGETVRAARTEVLHELDLERPTGFLREDRQLSTQLVMIRSRAVLAPVAEAHDVPLDELTSKVHVKVLDSSEVVVIEVHDESASRAQELVDAVTASYLEKGPRTGPREARTYLESQLAALEEQRQNVNNSLVELELERLADASPGEDTVPTASEIALRSELDSLIDQREVTRSRLEEVTIEELRQPRLEQITSSYVVDDAVSPKPLFAAVAGALAGLLAVVLGAITIIGWKNRVRQHAS